MHEENETSFRAVDFFQIWYVRYGICEATKCVKTKHVSTQISLFTTNAEFNEESLSLQNANTSSKIQDINEYLTM